MIFKVLVSVLRCCLSNCWTLIYQMKIHSRINRIKVFKVSTISRGLANAKLFFLVYVCCFSSMVWCINPSAAPSYLRSSENTIKTVVGNGDGITSSSGNVATVTSLNFPRDINQDTSGYMYFSEQGANCLRRYNPSNNIILSFAGQCGTAGGSGDGGAASSALVNIPVSIAIDVASNVYFCDFNNNRVRKVTSGVISPFAFTGTASNTGDNGAATAATNQGPHGVWVSSQGKVYIASVTYSTIRLVFSGTVTLYAGVGYGGFGGDGGAATSAAFASSERVSGDSLGRIYITDVGNMRIRTVSSGIMSTLVGTGTNGYNGDGQAGTSSSLAYPTGTVMDPSNGDLYISTLSDYRVRVMSGSAGICSTFVGSGVVSTIPTSTNGDNGAATACTLNGADGLYIDSVSHFLYVVDRSNNKIRLVYSTAPTAAPSVIPSLSPSAVPTLSLSPSINPSVLPTVAPSLLPSVIPTLMPTVTPTVQPSKIPSVNPSVAPSVGPSVLPSVLPSFGPTALPSALPTLSPSVISTVIPSVMPSQSPTCMPSVMPSVLPSLAPSNAPTTIMPTCLPSTIAPTSVPSAARSAYYSIMTVAGTGVQASTGTGGMATSAAFNSPRSVWQDTVGVVYVGDAGANCIRMFSSSTNIVQNYAGVCDVNSFLGDGGAASNAFLSNPVCIFIDSLSRMYIVDTSNARVRRVSESGIISTIAGSGIPVGDNGPATSANLGSAIGVWADTTGVYYVVEFTNNAVRVVNTAGIISLFAGTYSGGFSGDGGAATSGVFNQPDRLRGDTMGNIFISDTLNNRVRKVYGGVITTFMGTGGASFAENSVATSAGISFPEDMEIDRLNGDFYVAARNNQRVHVLTKTNGLVTSFVGMGGTGSSGDGGAATSATLDGPDGLYLNTQGSMYIGHVFAKYVRMVYPASPTSFPSRKPTTCGPTLSPSVVPTILPTAIPSTLPTLIPSVIPTLVPTRAPVTDTPTSARSAYNVITTAAGTGAATTSGTGGRATSAAFNAVRSLLQDTQGYVYLAESAGQCIRRFSSTTNIVENYVGVGGMGLYSGDGGYATAASLYAPQGIFLDSQGVLYIADFSNGRVRKVSTSNIITTVAGGGLSPPDSGAATGASIPQPMSVWANSVGVLYFSLLSSNTVRYVSTSGIIGLFAGTITGSAGDGGPATSAQLYQTERVRGDTAGVLYLGDSMNNRVRAVSSSGIISTLIGTGVATYSGENLPATSSAINFPEDMQIQPQNGDVYVSARSSQKVQVFTKATGLVSTFVGSGASGTSGDGGQATAALINGPDGLALNTLGQLYLAEIFSNYVRMVYPAAPTVVPTVTPTVGPSLNPSVSPSVQPTVGPTLLPSVSPTCCPSLSPTVGPSQAPSIVPSRTPSLLPSVLPSCTPTIAPTVVPTFTPSLTPSVAPSVAPSLIPTVSPSVAPTVHPSVVPSITPSSPPSTSPSSAPTLGPTLGPSVAPSQLPSVCPTVTPSLPPTLAPSWTPSDIPTETPSVRPSVLPSLVPTAGPSIGPSSDPTLCPSEMPSVVPSVVPSVSPSSDPSEIPSETPTVAPSVGPSIAPSAVPSEVPSDSPTDIPTLLPTTRPSRLPSIKPSKAPSKNPTCSPSFFPSVIPSVVPSVQPSEPPTLRPSDLPSLFPSLIPSVMPSVEPSTGPTLLPSMVPSLFPSEAPSLFPSLLPSVAPSLPPSCCPSVGPSVAPSTAPSNVSPSPTLVPSTAPVFTTTPTFIATVGPTTVAPAVSLPTRSPTTVIPTASTGVPIFSLKPTRPTRSPFKSSGFASLPSNASISVRGVSMTRFKIILPVSTTIVNRGVAFSDIVVPSGSMGTAFEILGRRQQDSSSIVLNKDLYPTFMNIFAVDIAKRSASVLQDVNGDGFDDLIIGDPFVSRCYVLFGNEDGLTNMTSGFTIFGEQQSDLTGWSVSGAGDVNNDTLHDIIVGAPNARGIGAFYIIYGRIISSDIHLRNLTSAQGFAVYGSQKSDFLGVSVSAAGDVNSDGCSDIIVGALLTSNLISGAAFVLYGCRPNPVNTGGLTQDEGFKLSGDAFSYTGSFVSGAGDVNGDGYDDVLVGSTPVSASTVTSTYLVFGGVNVTSSVMLASLTNSQGVHILGGGVFGFFVRDSNGDELSDIMVAMLDSTPVGNGLIVLMDLSALTPITVSPTEAPTVVPTTASPTYPATLKPSVHPTFTVTEPTVLPTFGGTNPSSHPSSQPSGPSVSPTVTPSLRLTRRPTAAPTIVPTVTVTMSPTTEPSTSRSPSTEKPIVTSRTPVTHPSQRPTVTLTMEPSAAPVKVAVQLINEPNAVYNLSNVDVQYLVNTSGSVTILGSGGVHVYVLYPTDNSTLTIAHFNRSCDVIDLTAFHHIVEFKQLQLSEGSVIVTLSATQTVHILNLHVADMSDHNFLFYKDKGKPEFTAAQLMMIKILSGLAVAVFGLVVLFMLRRGVLKVKKMYEVTPQNKLCIVIRTTLDGRQIVNSEDGELQELEPLLLESDQSGAEDDSSDRLESMLHEPSRFALCGVATDIIELSAPVNREEVLGTTEVAGAEYSSQSNEDDSMFDSSKGSWSGSHDGKMSNEERLDQVIAASSLRPTVVDSVGSESVASIYSSIPDGLDAPPVFENGSDLNSIPQNQQSDDDDVSSDDWLSMSDDD